MVSIRNSADLLMTVKRMVIPNEFHYRMKSKFESPRICLRTKIPARNYISTEMNPPNEYSANYLMCLT